MISRSRPAMGRLQRVPTRDTHPGNPHEISVSRCEGDTLWDTLIPRVRKCVPALSRNELHGTREVSVSQKPHPYYKGVGLETGHAAPGSPGLHTFCTPSRPRRGSFRGLPDREPPAAVPSHISARENRMFTCWEGIE